MMDEGGTSYTENFQTNNNDSSSRASTRSNSSRSCVPIFIKMLDTDDDEIKIFGHEIKLVNIVGVLKSCDIYSTKLVARVEDHTGSIKCTQWFESDKPNIKASELKIGQYVTVHGNVRNIQGTNEIIALNIENVNSANVITTFRLQAIQARYEFEADQSNQQSAADSTYNKEEEEMVCETSTMGINNMQEKILSIIKSINDCEGAHRNEILKHFEPFQHREVNESLSYLTEEGLVYTTMHHDLFKATDSF